jgi:hypothetical protein
MILFLLLSLHLHGLFAAEDAPATRPSDVARWLNDLAAEDAPTRAEARRKMLGMSAAQLKELRQLVADGQAVLPAQREALYEIVYHTFLRTRPYPVLQGDNGSFIGLFGQQVTDGGGSSSVAFERCLPGFDAYRVLENGDRIVGVDELPELRFEGSNPLGPVRQGFKAGTVIHFRIIRDSRVQRVALQLSMTPLWQQFRDMGELEAREELAKTYWQREFAPLLERRPS